MVLLDELDEVPRPFTPGQRSAAGAVGDGQEVSVRLLGIVAGVVDHMHSKRSASALPFVGRTLRILLPMPLTVAHGTVGPGFSLFQPFFLGLLSTPSFLHHGLVLALGVAERDIGFMGLLIVREVVIVLHAPFVVVEEVIIEVVRFPPIRPGVPSFGRRTSYLHQVAFPTCVCSSGPG